MLVAAHLRKGFTLHDGRTVNALDEVGFHIGRGRFFTLLGPSGCGKTTTLRSIAGLERPDSGRIEVAGRPLFDSGKGIFVPPNRRNMGMVFQSYAIWPHMDVFENVAFPLRVGQSKVGAAELARKVTRALETVQLAGYERRPATRLSGGQQQRLALARALVMEPDLLLLDEPLSNLDAKLREAMRLELRRLQREVGITTVYVTHDQSEALALSDDIAVMKDGRIVQFGDPETIYSRPASRFVASFIGSTNVIEGRMRSAPDKDGHGLVEIPGGVIACLFGDPGCRTESVAVSIRPENLEMLDPARPADPQAATNVLEGRVTERVFLGETIDYLVDLAGRELRVRGHPSRAFPLQAPVHLRVAARDCLAVPDDVSPR